MAPGGPTDTTEQRFWDRVQPLLDERNLSLAKLSRLCGCTDAALRNYARGSQPTIEPAARIAAALNVSLDHLAGLAPAPPADGRKAMARWTRDVDAATARLRRALEGGGQ